MHPFTRKRSEAVASLGELKLIARIRHWLGNASPPTPHGIGDDCAVLPPSSKAQAITVDPVIFNRHFDSSVAPRDVGAKLLKRNLSDLAAMGAQPTAAVVALSIAPELRIAWLEGFYRGIAAVARQYGVPIVGGDVAQADHALTASLTLLGRSTGKRLVTRHGAQLGDWIYVTGLLGGSILGHHYDFTPRLEEGAWLASRAEVVALMDVSDGLAKDLHALVPRGARPYVDPERVPISPAASTLAATTGRTALHHALADGEDYELAFAVAGGTNLTLFERAWRRRFTTQLTCIGQFVPTRAREPRGVNLASIHGYEHLSQA